MINACRWKLSRQISTPYDIIHGNKPNTRTWFALLSVRYFDQVKYDNIYRYSSQSNVWKTLISCHYTNPQQESYTYQANMTWIQGDTKMHTLASNMMELSLLVPKYHTPNPFRGLNGQVLSTSKDLQTLIPSNAQSTYNPYILHWTASLEEESTYYIHLYNSELVNNTLQKINSIALPLLPHAQ